LNENLDNLKTFNKLKGNVQNELDNYRSVQADIPNFNLEKNPFARNIKINLDASQEKVGNDQALSTDESISSESNIIFQTLSDFGKKLKKILTPKNTDSLQQKRGFDQRPSLIFGDKEPQQRTHSSYVERNSLFPLTSCRGSHLLVTNTDGNTYRKSVINLLRDASEKPRFSIINPVYSDMNRTDSSGFSYGLKTNGIVSAKDMLSTREDGQFQAPHRFIAHKRNSSANTESMMNMRRTENSSYPTSLNYLDDGNAFNTDREEKPMRKTTIDSHIPRKKIIFTSVENSRATTPANSELSRSTTPFNDLVSSKRPTSGNATLDLDFNRVFSNVFDSKSQNIQQRKTVNIKIF